MPAHKTLNIHLPEWLYQEIDEEARVRKTTKGAVARQRLGMPVRVPTGELISDLFGTADDLPPDLSERKSSDTYGHDGCR
jgi:hypothetical protein